MLRLWTSAHFILAVLPPQNSRQVINFWIFSAAYRYLVSEQKNLMKPIARYQFCCSLALVFVCAFYAFSHPPLHDSDLVNLRATLTDARQARERFAYKDALLILDRASRNYKNSADLLAEYGYIWLDAEDMERAVGFFDRALKMQPTCERAVAGRAAADLMRRDFASAETRLRDFLSNNPQSSIARATLARVYFESDRTADAEYEASRVLTVEA